VPILTTSSCARPSVMCKKTQWIEERLRSVPEALEQDALRHLGSAGAVRVAAHAVDHQEECGVFSHRRSYPVLVLFTCPEKANIGVLDLQEAAFASVRLDCSLYPPAHERKP
jgi:hypothetical protein